jgi:hypothetical protein
MICPLISVCPKEIRDINTAKKVKKAFILLDFDEAKLQLKKLE